MAKPIFSIVIPAYNEEKYILRSVKSAVDQKFSGKFEVIVIDNNSTDQTAALVKKNYPAVRVIPEKEQGLVAARIKGVKEAKGEIIAFMDADTKATSHWLEDMYRIYQKNSKVVGVSQMVNLRPKNWIVDAAQPVTGFGQKYLKLMAGCHFSFRKDAYIKSGGYSKRKEFYAEDVYISKKLKNVGKIVIQDRGSVTASSRRLTTLETSLPYFWKFVSAAIGVYIKEYIKKNLS